MNTRKRVPGLQIRSSTCVDFGAYGTNSEPAKAGDRTFSRDFNRLACAERTIFNWCYRELCG